VRHEGGVKVFDIDFDGGAGGVEGLGVLDYLTGGEEERSCSFL